MTSTRKAVYAPSPSTAKGSPTAISAFKEDKIVYANGKTVVIRSLTDPAATFLYSGHSKEVVSASVAPSGYYVASADVSGTVRIWDATPALKGTLDEPILKNEVRALSGRINDVQWDGESKRLIAVGEGKESFGSAFTYDSGNSCGEISGHAKVINSVAIRHQRPFRAVTASDDNSLVFMTGVPFKFSRVLKTHTSFVNAVRYAPSGALFASASADRKLCLYDGTTGDPLHTLSGHTGSILSLSFSLDSKFIATASTDTTCRLWDVETQQATSTWDCDGHQVGITHVGDLIVSVSLNGDLNLIDPRADTPARILSGHQKSITCLVSSDEGTGPTLFSGSYDGRLNSFDVDAGRECKAVAGAGHSNQVVDVASSDGQVVSVGMDDTLRFVDVSKKEFKSDFASTLHLPKTVLSDPNGNTYLLTTKDIQKISREGTKLASTPLSDATALSYSITSAQLAVSLENGQIEFYSSSELKKEAKKVHANGSVTRLAYSPDGRLLAVGLSTGKIVVYDSESLEVRISQWVFHTARINCITWSKDSKFALSGSLDSNVYVWSVEKPMRKVAIKNAHFGGVTGAEWITETRIATAGADAALKVYDIVLPGV